MKRQRSLQPPPIVRRHAGICSWPHAWAGSAGTGARQQHGLLRRCRHRAHGIGLGLERDHLLGIFRQSRRDGRVVCSRQANRAAGGPFASTPTRPHATHARRTGRQAGLSHRRQRGRTAFAPCPACRPQHAVQRAPPVIGQRARRGRRAWDLGPAQAPSETFMRLVSVYRAMAAAPAADWDAPPAFCRRRRFRPRHAAPFPRRGRRGRASSWQDRRVAADQRYRHARHRQRPGARATFPQASSTRLHRLAVTARWRRYRWPGAAASERRTRALPRCAAIDAMPWRSPR